MKNKQTRALAFIVLLALLFLIWKFIPPKKIHLQATKFSELPGWENVDARKSLKAFQISCKALLRKNPELSVGTDLVPLKAKDWQDACRAAMTIKISKSAAARFFQKWFVPVEFVQNGPIEGLFTGYYMPRLRGSLKKSKSYDVPLYGKPSDLVTVDLSEFSKTLKYRPLVGRVKDGKLVPYFTRAEINDGAIKHIAPVVVWVDSLIDRSFLEIQGSGIIDLKGGGELLVGYEASNGQPYTSLAKVLIDKGVMTFKTASMQSIRIYLEAHPDEINSVLNQNKSFVFFRRLEQRGPLGTLGVVLTPGYSLAVDKDWVPLGAPIWLTTTYPMGGQQQVLHRLMIAQDTGGAIKGRVRGDVYWGAGETATDIAGKMKNRGYYWLLLPKQVVLNQQ